MLNRANPDRDYRILVKYNRQNPKWHKIYEGKWTADAAYRYENNAAALKRIQPVVTDAEVAEVINESASLVLLDDWLDELYSLPGDAGVLPNRAEFDRAFLEAS